MKCSCVECGGKEFLGFTACCFGDKGGMKEVVFMAVVRFPLIMGEKVPHGVETHQTDWKVVDVWDM